jgi:predicted ABC-type ATPase
MFAGPNGSGKSSLIQLLAKDHERYERCLQLVGAALKHEHRAYFFDNSGLKPMLLAELHPDGDFELKVSKESLPNWFQKRVAPSAAL